MSVENEPALLSERLAPANEPFLCLLFFVKEYKTEFLFMIIRGLSKDLMSAVAVFFSIVSTEIEPCCFVRAFYLNIILKCRYSSPFF